jgi:hypothetical protein
MKTLGEIALHLVNLSDDPTQSDAHRRVASAALGAMADALYEEACEENILMNPDPVCADCGSDLDAMGHCRRGCAGRPPWPAREGLPKDDDDNAAGRGQKVRHG